MQNLSLPKQFNKDDKYEQVLEELANQYAEEVYNDQEPGSQFMTPEVKKNKYKEEFKNSVRLEEFEKDLVQAVSILINEGERFLEKPEWENLQNELINCKKTLAELSYEDDLPDVLYPSLGMSQRSLHAIDSIARELYRLQEYSKTASLNVFLITLDGTNANYWYNLGMSLQDAGNYEKAISAYACCRVLDPKNIGAYLFSAECYLTQGNKQEALLDLEDGERLVEKLTDSTPWDSFITTLKECL